MKITDTKVIPFFLFARNKIKFVFNFFLYYICIMSLIPITYFKNYNDAVFYSLGGSMNNKNQLPQMLVIIIYNSMGEFEELKVVDMDDEVLELNPEQKDIFI